MHAWRLATLALLIVSCASPVLAYADDAAKPSLRWTSKQEKGLYGYIIYRSDNIAGPFLRINERIVPRRTQPAGSGAEDGTSPTQYQYVDDTAKAGKVYFYYIDAIATTGRKQRLTGVVRKVLPAED